MQSGLERAEAQVPNVLTHGFDADPDPRFRCGFDIALVFMRMGYRVRRADWPEEDAISIYEGSILRVVSTQQIMEMLPMSDILAMDWTVAAIPKDH
jgi:hypothetical protein